MTPPGPARAARRARLPAPVRGGGGGPRVVGAPGPAALQALQQGRLRGEDSKDSKGFKKFIGSPKGKYTDMSEAQFKNNQKFGYKQK